MYYDDFMCKGKSYQIKEGDTLYGISRRERIPLDWILQANPYVNVYQLQIGDWICIPKKNYQEEDDDYRPNGDNMVLLNYVVGENENLGQLLERFDLDLRDLLKFNGMNAIMLREGSILKIPKEADDLD
ncbi:MAG: LysM peptidoglycan-binding domain-containing protein [Lachnospiraceae bacterium]|nr:LysM peptidoglycan-binding domain-containing protein [Lachnospiraceae bacterium]